MFCLSTDFIVAGTWMHQCQALQPCPEKLSIQLMTPCYEY